MIRFDENTNMRLFIIFKDNGDRADIKIEDFLEMVDLFDTIKVNDDLLGYSVMYWEFLHACLKNIETGCWTTLPRFWVEIVNMTRDTPMAEFERAAEYRKYLIARRGLCDRLSIDPVDTCDRELLYKWTLNTQGQNYILSVAHALLRMHIFFNKEYLKGIENNAAIKTTPFTNIDQVIHPVKGGTKEQVLRENFKHPLKRHERFI